MNLVEAVVEVVVVVTTVANLRLDLMIRDQERMTTKIRKKREKEEG